MSPNKLAVVAEKDGRRREALALAETGLALAERLAALDATNATWRNDVVFSRVPVARLRGDRGPPPGQSLSNG